MKIDNLYQLYKIIEKIIAHPNGAICPVRISIDNSQCELDQFTLDLRVIKDFNYVEFVLFNINRENES